MSGSTVASFGPAYIGNGPYIFGISRLLADSARLLGDHEDARTQYVRALDGLGKMGFRPEVALTRLHLAELLLDHFPDKHAEAIEHLDFAINEFRDMKMQPSLERALGRKQVLGA